MGNDLLLCHKAFKEKRKGVGGMRKEKSSRRPLNKEDSAQIASERPTSQRGAPNRGKTSSNSEDVVRARERRRQSRSSLPCCWGPLSISSALRIAVHKVFCRGCPVSEAGHGCPSPGSPCLVGSAPQSVPSAHKELSLSTVPITSLYKYVKNTFSLCQVGPQLMDRPAGQNGH